MRKAPYGAFLFGDKILIEFVVNIVSFVANFLTIIASSIAIYIFIYKKEELKAVFKVLINYSYQTTIEELKGKLERINEYRVDNPNDLPEIKNIFHEIAGQIRGNRKLTLLNSSLADKIERVVSDKKFLEPQKRALVSEVREILKNLNVDTYEDVIGVKK